MKKFLLLLTLVIMPCLLFAEERMVIRFSEPDEAILAEFMTPGRDVAAYKPGAFLDLVVTGSQYEELLARGFALEVTQTEAHLKHNLKMQPEADAASESPIAALGTIAGYRNYSNLLAELQQIESQHPSICKLYNLGAGWGKHYSDSGNPFYDDYRHDIWALKVSDNVAIEEDEPAVYYLGAHHAREPISLEVAMAVLYHIVDNYGIDPTITDHVDRSQIWFVPLVNPDGHRVVTESLDIWWRKNMRDNNQNGEFDSNFSVGASGLDGVDPNRNYGFQWGSGGASEDPQTPVYQGPDPWSEPEIQAIKDLLDFHHFVAGISYHSFGQLVIYPYAYARDAQAPDSGALEELAVAMAETIPASGGGHYTPKASGQLYPASGATEDYAYGVHGIFNMTIELGTQFIPPAGEIETLSNDNLAAAMILLDRVNHSTLTGHITDAASGQPLVAEIFISGIDDSGVFRYPFRSNAQFGRYYRLLQAGSYTVTYAAEGYETVTLENIAVTAVGQTVQDVALTPAVLPVYPDITANGSNWPLIIRAADNLTVSVTFDSGANAGVPADWWLLAETPEGWYYYNYYRSEWLVGQSPTYQGGLDDVTPLEVLNTSNLPTGLYTIYFGVDGYKNGQISYGTLFYDSVVVYIMP